MLTLKLDPSSSFAVRWPSSYRSAVALAEAYVTYESSLAPAEQLQDVPLSAIQAALADAQTAIHAARSGERGRASAGEIVQQTYEALKPLIDKAIAQLKAKHFDHLALLEEWGLDTVVRQGKVQVRKPASQSQRLEFVEAYIAREASLPPEEQISDPPLATMQAHLSTIQTSMAQRTSGRDQREMNVQVRNTAVARLLDLLKVAAAIRVAMLHGGLVTNDLQPWGFQVVGRVTSGNGTREAPISTE